MVRGDRDGCASGTLGAGLSGGARSTPIGSVRPVRRSSAGGRRTARSGGRSRGGWSPRPRRRATVGIAVGANQRAAEDRDLARDRGRVGAERRPRHALVEAVQPGRPDARQLVRGRLVLDDDRDRAESLGERSGADGRSPDRWPRRRRRRSRRPGRSAPDGVAHPIPPANAPSDEDRHEVGRVEVRRRARRRPRSPRRPAPGPMPTRGGCRVERHPDAPERGGGRPRLGRQCRSIRPRSRMAPAPIRSSTAGRSAAVRPALAGRRSRRPRHRGRRPAARPPSRCAGNPPRPSAPTPAASTAQLAPFGEGRTTVVARTQRSEARRRQASGPGLAGSGWPASPRSNGRARPRPSSRAR